MTKKLSLFITHPLVWSDETKINRLNSDGRKLVWKKKSGELTEQHVQGTVQFDGDNILLWGCMTARGVGYACRIDNKMSGDLYIGILGDELQSSLDYYGLEHNNIIFQHDNASVHTTQKVKKWFEENQIEVLKCPAQSPDLNPIDHL